MRSNCNIVPVIDLRGNDITSQILSTVIDKFKFARPARARRLMKFTTAAISALMQLR